MGKLSDVLVIVLQESFKRKDACSYPRLGGKASSEGKSMYMHIPLYG